MYICEGVTTNTIQKYDAYKKLVTFTDVQMVTFTDSCKIMVVNVCFLIQADVIPSSVVTNARSWS